ncbi:MAG TPA: GNAT family N-acetyltransferase [Gaiellales bacterium]|jgi:RimJ/RimL family protein N-acetyltransferase|nr:GNAT family N-acetyltransferase [Gaiellales bacterium]
MTADAGFTVIETPRLVLRRFDAADLDAFVAYRADAGVAQFQSWEAGYSRAQGEQFIDWVTSVHPDTPGEWYQFAIERRAAPGLIGDCAARFDPAGVEIGFTLAPAHQRRGYATEAVAALLGYIRSRGHSTAVAWCDVENLASRRVLERLGFAFDDTVAGEHRFTLDLGIAPSADRQPAGGS